MKHPVIVVSLLLIFGLSAFASQADNKQRPDIDYLITQLSLDDSKAQQLKDLMQQHHQAMNVAKDQRQKNRQQNQDMRIQHREELLTVLSYEQLYQFEEYMQQFHRSHGKPAHQ